jgi:hypothetical protein
MIKLMDLLEDIDIEKHLKERGVDPNKTEVIMDKKDNVATFLLYNLSGQLVGYQRYNPAEDKKRDNAGRYFTWVSKEGDVRKLAVWGTETIKPSVPYLFIVEGIFDCVKLHNGGHPAIAILGNNQKVLRSWFRILNKKIIAITDNYASGNMMKKFAWKAFQTPDPYKYLGEMPQQKVNEFIK